MDNKYDVQRVTKPLGSSVRGSLETCLNTRGPDWRLHSILSDEGAVLVVWERVELQK